MKSPKIPAALVACFLPFAALAASPIDGSWWASFKGPDSTSPMVLTFTFKVDGDKVTGSVDGDNGPSPIASGSIKGDTFEFKVNLDGTLVNHVCKVSGDTIDMTFTFGGQAPTHMKLGRVVVPVAATDPSGFWRWTVSPQGTGQAFRVSARLSYADGKLSGTYSSRMEEAPISDASFTGGAIAFSVVRERDGKQFVVKYKGTLSGDSITGTLELPGFDGGESATVDWKAARAR